MKLTNTTCKNAKPGTKARKISDGDGMYLEVMPNGSKYWRLKYRILGKEKRLALGVYPEVSLNEARDKRAQARKLLAEGSDPSLAKQEAKRIQTLNSQTTFEAITREWHAHFSSRWTERHAVYILRRLEADIFPSLGGRPITEITAPQLLDSLRKIEKRGAHEIAHRVLQMCGQVFRFAIATGRAERNPAADLKGALKPVQHGHYAALDIKDLPEFLGRLGRNEARLYVQTRLAIQLLMQTFVRTGELINARWNELRLEDAEWHIPAERMKMRQPHIVPLSRQSLELLEELKALNGHREWIFPNQHNPKKPMSNNTILFALKRLGYGGRATGHGFRALAMSTIKEKLNYRHEVVDRQLAHAPRSKVAAAYDRAKFLDERRKMMQEWADYLDQASQNSLNVVLRKTGTD